MSDKTEYGEIVFDDTSMIGDNTDRNTDAMAVPSVGKTSIVRYKVGANLNANVNCMALVCDYQKLLLWGAYKNAQDGAQIQVRFGGTIKFEQKFNWTGLQGYIGGADDYNSENEIMLSGYDTLIDASTAIDVYITGKTNVRRMIYATLYGTLDDGTRVRAEVKQAVDGTAATSVPLYTVPAGRTLDMHQLVISVRHIDLYAGKAYMTYNGLPVMAFDVAQTEIGGVYGLVFPFYDLPLKESASLGFRHDSYECGDELIAASVYSTEQAVSAGAVYPAENDVRNGVDYGPTGADYDGDLVLPVVADVKSGVSYGADETEYTGTYAAGGGGGVSRGRIVNASS